MANDDNEDDKPTVVININELKKQTQLAEKELNNITQDLEFATQGPSVHVKPKCLLFELGGNFFAEHQSFFPQDVDLTVLKELKELNTQLKANPDCYLFFNYHSGPKQINALCTQIKKKFTKTKLIICVKNLSKEKMQQHKNSAAGAHAYLDIPLNTDQIKEKMRKL